MKNSKRFMASILCSLLAFCMILPVSASEDPVDWALTQDLSILSHGEASYDRIEVPYDTWFRPHALYQYSLTVESEALTYHGAQVGQPMTAEQEIRQELVFLFNSTQIGGLEGVYVNADSRAIIEDFCAGKYAQYELGGADYSAVIDNAAVELWRNTTPDLETDTITLDNASYYYVFGYDATLSIARVVGIVFDLDGEYLYVRSEYCTDIHGLLSLRPGTVPALGISGAHANLINQANEESDYFTPDVTYETSSPLHPTVSMVAFLILALPLMFLLPALLLALGIVMRNLKKIPNRKRWKAVIIGSSVWLGGSVIVSLLLLIPTFFL